MHRGAGLGGTYPSTFKAARPRMQGWGAGRRTSKNTGEVRQVLSIPVITQSSQLGVVEGQTDSPRLPGSKFSIPRLSVSIPAASSAEFCLDLFEKGAG